MFLDALRAEIFKVAHNRVNTFFAYAFYPSFTLVASLLMELLVRRGGRGAALEGSHPVKFVLDGLGSPTEVFAYMLFCLGAATLFAGEYRWQTWRAIAPRNGRFALMAAKLCVFVIFGVLACLLSGLTGLLYGLFKIGVLHQPGQWPDAGANIPAAMLVQLGASFLMLMWMASITMLAAVISRSLIGSAIATFLIFVGTSIAFTRLNFPQIDWWGWMLPQISQFSLKAHAQNFIGEGPPFGLGLDIAPQAVAAMAAEIAALIGAAFWLLRRQDFSEE
jgi:ABC-2 type transport system permease protein